MKAFMGAIGSVIDKATSLSRYAGFACLLAVAGMTSSGTIARYFFNKPFVFTEDIVMALIIPLVTCSLAYVFQIKGHIRADLVLRLLPLKWQKYLDRVTDLLTIVILAVIATEFYRQMGNCPCEYKLKGGWLWSSRSFLKLVVLAHWH